jgi:hypothetical protein
LRWLPSSALIALASFISADCPSSSALIAPPHQVCASFHHNAMGREGLGCGGRAHEDALRALLLHNRWNVFQSAEDYVVWEVAPARLSDGSVVDLWREESSPIAWQVRIASLISADSLPNQR